MSSGAPRQSSLRETKVRTLAADYFSPFDLYTPNGTRLEVKWSPFGVIARKCSRYSNGRRGWQFNIHRHGNIDNGNVDFYILVCQPSQELVKIGFGTPIFLVVQSPITIPVVRLSLRTMLMKWGAKANAVEPLKAFDATRTEKDRERAFLQANPVESPVAVGKRKARQAREKVQSA